MTCRNSLCDGGYIRLSIWDDEIRRHVPVDYLCKDCS